MNASIEQVREKLRQVRANPETKRKFPKQLWEEICVLADHYSVEVISQKLDIGRDYLYEKLGQRKKGQIEFCEVIVGAPKEIVIELYRGELKGRIEGASADLINGSSSTIAIVWYLYLGAIMYGVLLRYR